ncbi:MAG: class I SAM-dependent methyltransferase [Fibrobacteria bacterium]
MSPLPICRFCNAPLTQSFADLGSTPFSNSYLSAENLERMEPTYPLHARVCGSCFLVQLESFESPHKIFSEYAYFSSFSDTWLKHAQAYAVKVSERFALHSGSRVMEIASNDGYLLRWFKELGISVLGIEPAANVAREAEAKGIPSRVMFFGSETAKSLAASGEMADLTAANNVLAHVPDINDFVAGFPIVLKPEGVSTFEFPHLLRLMENRQFDTIYHEHFSYLSLTTVQRNFESHGLRVFDVEELSTHGGSLRVYACHRNAAHKEAATVAGLLERERDFGLRDLSRYATFGEEVKSVKRDLLSFLIEAKRAGKSIAGYGAPAKGNTLLNYCGIRTDFIDFTVDRSPHKQGTWLPGTRIPVKGPEHIRIAKPDYLLILPWNLRDEVMDQMAYIREWGGRFVLPIPSVAVV